MRGTLAGSLPPAEASLGGSGEPWDGVLTASGKAELHAGPCSWPMQLAYHALWATLLHQHLGLGSPCWCRCGCWPPSLCGSPEDRATTSSQRYSGIIWAFERWSRSHKRLIKAPAAFQRAQGPRQKHGPAPAPPCPASSGPGGDTRQVQRSRSLSRADRSALPRCCACRSPS